MNNWNSRTFQMHSGGRDTYWCTVLLALASGVAALIVSAWVVDTPWWVGALGIGFLVAGLAGLIRPETTIESDVRVVYRRFRLFGHFLLWSRRYPFSEFVAVVVRRVRHSGDSDEYFVSLRRCVGRQLLISYFQAGINGESGSAGELAHRLSTDLQLRIEERGA
jgi:hypothetical protein